MPHDIRSPVLNAIYHAMSQLGDDPASARYLKPFQQAIDIIEAVPPYRPCRFCMDYMATGFCTTWKQQIPSEWLEIGCDNWLDTVPF